MVAPTIVAPLFSVGAHIVRPRSIALHSPVGDGASTSRSPPYKFDLLSLIKSVLVKKKG